MSIDYLGDKHSIFYKIFLICESNMASIHTPPSDDFIQYLFKSYGLFTFIFYHNRSFQRFHNSILIKRCSTFLVRLRNDLSSSFSKNWSRNLRRSSKLEEAIQQTRTTTSFHSFRYL